MHITERRERDKALKLCRGSYQRDIILGRQNLSGSDLKGKAKKYGVHYARSKNSLLARLQAHQVEFAVCVVNRKNVLAFGERQVFLHTTGRLVYKTPLWYALVRATDTGYRYRAVRALVELVTQP